MRFFTDINAPFIYYPSFQRLLLKKKKKCRSTTKEVHSRTVNRIGVIK